MKKENLDFVLVNLDKTLRTPKEAVVEEKKESFCCRICGSETYKEVTKNNGVSGPGHWSKILYYVCNGCSFHFNDLELAAK